MSSESLIAGSRKGLQTGFYCGNGSIGNDRGKGTGFISHHEVKQRLVGDRVRAVVVCKFSMGDRFGPECRIIATEDSEIGFNFLVYLFCFTICLWVVGSRQG